MASGTSPKKDKVILLLKQGETSPTIIANKVGCAVSYARLVKDEFLRSQKAPESTPLLGTTGREVRAIHSLGSGSEPLWSDASGHRDVRQTP